MATNEPLACVLGDMDLVRPLGLGGIRCAVVAGPDAPVRFSRFTRDAIDLSTPSLASALIDRAGAEPEPPVLFYESDESLRFVSDNRGQLAHAYRFLMPDAELVEDLLDKSRFRLLAKRLDLPVPPSLALRPAAGSGPEDVALDFPVIVKPLPYRDERWERINDFAEEARSGRPKALRALSAKVLPADSPEALGRLWPRLAQADTQFLFQELIPGPETRIESYHVYVDGEGNFAAEFTGRKIRTYPPRFGITTALTTTDDSSVLSLGRELVRRLDFRGAAKFDFKRGPDGRLHLLEINPRFTLWGHAGAAAGVNLPAVAYAERAGMPLSQPSRARAGVSWCRPRRDAAAAKALGVPFRRWLGWALRCDVNSSFARDDPFPFLSTKVSPRLVERARASLSFAP